VEIVAENSGVLNILKPPGERIPVGQLIGTIDDAAQPSAATTSQPPKLSNSSAAALPASTPSKAPPPAPSPARAQAAAQPANLSLSVRKMAAEKQIDPAQISATGKDGRITKGDVLQYNAQGRPAGAPPAKPSAAPSPVPSAPQTADRPGDRRVAMSMLR